MFLTVRCNHYYIVPTQSMLGWRELYNWRLYVEDPRKGGPEAGSASSGKRKR